MICIKFKDQKFLRFEDDPRYIAKKAEDYVYNQGQIDTILLGPEFEFYVLDHISFKKHK